MILEIVYRDCDLITAGELFGRSGYGVGLQKGSPWADKITLAILDYHESEWTGSWLQSAVRVNQSMFRWTDGEPG